MARKVLVISVGGACEPIITSIKNHKPDKIYFICSDDNPQTNSKGSYISVIGEGNVCSQGKKPSIAKQLELSDEIYDVIKLKKGSEDDLGSTFQTIKMLLDDINKQTPEVELILDYTGGTKTMSAALAIASTFYKTASLSIVTGLRKDLIKVVDKSETAIFSNISPILIERQLLSFQAFIKKYDYHSASTVIDEILKYKLDTELRVKMLKYLTLAKAFDAWDRFDHTEAYNLLNTFRKEFLEYILPLERVIKTRINVDTNFSQPQEFPIKDKKIYFDIVYDIIYNAERKAAQEHYDDAVARIYRALELFVQLYLLTKYRINTSNVQLELLPKELRSEYENKINDKKIRLGLMEAYELVSKLEKDSDITKLFLENKSEILNKLEIRNFSILAHGYTPITKDLYQKVWNVHVEKFLKKALSLVIPENQKFPIKQLPVNL